MRVLLAGGGTAGHINPALAIAGEIKKNQPDAKIAFVGNAGSMEERLVGREGYQFYAIPVRGFQRSFAPRNIVRNAQAAWYLALSPGRCKKILRDFQPDVVVGTGGYVSGPIVQAAAKAGIKTAIHEQNAAPGMTTRLLSKVVDTVCISVEESRPLLAHPDRCVLTGNPVRESVIMATPREARKKYGIADDEICILSFGGSLGARPVNEVAADLMAHSVRKWPKVRHIHAYGGTGKDDFVNRLRAGGVTLPQAQLDCREYIDDMGSCLAAADIVISRAGAITISELQAAGRAAILIPSPYVAENHQYKNALVLQKAGAAVIIEERDLTGKKLIDAVGEFIDDPARIKQFARKSGGMAIVDASNRIYREILSLTR